MKWTAELPDAYWLRASLDDPWRATMHDAVPRHFPAYARIFHPAFRDRPVGRPWPPIPYAAHRREWEAFEDARPEIDGERVRWAEAATAFGTVFHPLAQWDSLVAPGRAPEEENGPRDAAGWRYSAPAQGDLDADALRALADILSAHTSTPDDGVVAIWEGWGGLVGAPAVTPSRAFLSAATDRAPERHDELLARSIGDPLNDAFRKARWQSGILSDEISRGDRLQLPGRDYVVFRGGISEFAGADGERRMPWHDPDAPVPAQSPNVIWPADRAWVLVSEIDWDSTIVAGSVALVEAICAMPDLEARPLAENASLQWDADRINA